MLVVAFASGVGRQRRLWVSTHEHSEWETPGSLLFWLVRRKGAVIQGSREKHLWGISESELDKKKILLHCSWKEACKGAAELKKTVSPASPLALMPLGCLHTFL